MKLDETQIENIAKICHEANRAYCATLGDTSQQPWESAPDWQKESAIKGVKHHLMNPHSKPEDSHNSWLQEKTDAGWVYGEQKNPDAEPPTHPCIMPFEKLPTEQQKKDHLFLGIVRALAW